MNILITGIAGFIGYHVAKSLIGKHHVIGVDNFNSYIYSQEIKYTRMKLLGVDENNISILMSSCHYNDITNKENLEKIFRENSFDVIIHLAAIANPRLSSKFPDELIKTNVYGTCNVLECVRKFCPEAKVIIASSSSVKYKPYSLYAITKQQNETLAEFYAENYHLKIICIRPHTVYGPYGRPDMMIPKFIDSIIHDQTITLYNNGDTCRDFTYIDDLVNCINLTLSNFPDNFSVYDIGTGIASKVSYVLKLIESSLHKKAKIDHRSLENEIPTTQADISPFYKRFGNYQFMTLNEAIPALVNHILYESNK